MHLYYAVFWNLILLNTR